MKNFERIKWMLVIYVFIAGVASYFISGADLVLLARLVGFSAFAAFITYGIVVYRAVPR